MRSQLEEQIDALKRELWFRGDLRYMTRIGPQRDAYDFIHERDRSISAFSPFVFNFHRRLGKTFLSILLCTEVCLKAPGRIAKLAAPSLTQAADILDEQWPILMQDCPGELEPDPYKNEKYTFRNPRWGPKNRWIKSLLRLYGVKNDRGNKMRGGSTDVGIFDECREMQDLAYTWQSVLLPTFSKRVDPLALFISTPPDSMDHPFVSVFLQQAREFGHYMCVPARDDPNWTKEEDEMFAREMGGRDSADYRREIQCELVSDASNLIVPEFAQRDYEENGKLKNPYVLADYPRPAAYFAYTMGDMGGAGKRTDHTGILFGFVDFIQGKLAIEDELFLRDVDTRSLADLWKKRSQDLYDPEIERHAERHVAGLKWWIDATPQQIIDLYRLYHLNAHQVPNIERDVARRLLRTAFVTGRIIISPRCEELQYQLRNGTKLPNGDFARSRRLGHCDLIAALISLYRMVNFEENPSPVPEYSTDKWFVPPKKVRKKSGWDKFFATSRRR